MHKKLYVCNEEVLLYHVNTSHESYGSYFFWDVCINDPRKAVFFVKNCHCVVWCVGFQPFWILPVSWVYMIEKVHLFLFMFFFFSKPFCFENAKRYKKSNKSWFCLFRFLFFFHDFFSSLVMKICECQFWFLCLKSFLNFPELCFKIMEEVPSVAFHFFFFPQNHLFFTMQNDIKWRLSLILSLSSFVFFWLFCHEKLQL